MKITICILLIVMAFISGAFTSSIIESEFNGDLFESMSLCFSENYQLRSENKDLSQELMLLKYPQLSNETFMKELTENLRWKVYIVNLTNKDLCSGIYDCAIQQRRGKE